MTFNEVCEEKINQLSQWGKDNNLTNFVNLDDINIIFVHPNDNHLFFSLSLDPDKGIYSYLIYYKETIQEEKKILDFGELGAIVSREDNLTEVENMIIDFMSDKGIRIDKELAKTIIFVAAANNYQEKKAYKLLNAIYENNLEEMLLDVTWGKTNINFIFRGYKIIVSKRLKRSYQVIVDDENEYFLSLKAVIKSLKEIKDKKIGEQ